MQSRESEDGYDLGRDFLASARLNLQHYLWKATLGYTLHPQIPIDSENLRIAEVGTGTGVFLLELARQLPHSCHLDGFDISASQFPQQVWLPSNVTFQTLNAKEEPPHHLLEQYDVVHLRLFTLVVDDDDPRPVLSHCMKLLKPGGHLQWDEYSQAGTEIVSTASSVPKEYITRMHLGVGAVKPLTWIPKLDEIFKEFGFENVTLIKRSATNDLVKMFTEMACVMHLEHAALLDRDPNGPPNGGDGVRKLVNAVSKEVQQGAFIRHMLQVVVARKP